MEGSKKIKLLRISTVSHSLNILLKGQLKFMEEKGLNVSTCCSYSEDIEKFKAREKVSYYNVFISRHITPITDLKSLIGLIKVIRDFHPDIVHTHSPKAGILGMLAAKIANVPCRIHTVAGLPLTDVQGWKFYLLKYVEKLTYACANYVLPNSMNLKDYILKEIYNNKNKIKVIGYGSSNGINLNYYNREKLSDKSLLQLRYNLGLKSDTIVFSFLGRLASSKGIKELVHAFIEIKHFNTKLLLIGPHDNAHPLDKDTLDIIEYNKNIITVGHQDDVREFLAISNIFVFPSYREGFPQSLMQAIAMELPCIATNINGCNELIVDGESGYLIPIKDVSALKEKMLFLLENESVRKKMGQCGINNLKMKFDQKYVWNEIYQFYLSAVK